MSNSKVLAFYITICVLAFIASKITIAVLCYRRWQRKHMVLQDGNFTGGKLVMFQSPKLKSIKSNTFMKKTTKLSSKDIIGSGGFGTVYKLAINESLAFAIKRLNRATAEQDRGKSVKKKILDWPSRYKIAVGAARGLSYLHHDCVPHIIHRDIKSSNILLDHNLEARVSDFGLATLMEPNKTHVSTLIAGTFGYLAPEYFDTGKATTKGDVYSYGVVLLELLTGRKPTDEAFVEEGTKLVTWVKAVLQEKREVYVLDSSLNDCPLDEISLTFNIAMKCIEPDPSRRPTMADVLRMLEQLKTDEVVSQ
ncbi:hypothetical protein Leryth_010038 [Lithospermum erythrorhizon]|nr:hypothetical protein Leryth_010038 [Lithospermum erythrorhizon]